MERRGDGGMERDGRGGKAEEGWGRKERYGVDTFERWCHLVGVNRNDSIYITPIYFLKMESPFQRVDVHTIRIPPGEGKMEWGRRGRGRLGLAVGALIPSNGDAIF